MQGGLVQYQNGWLFPDAKTGALNYLNMDTQIVEQIQMNQDNTTHQLKSVSGLIVDSTMPDGCFLCCDMANNAIRRLIMPQAQHAVENRYQDIRSQVQQCSVELQEMVDVLATSCAAAGEAVSAAQMEVADFTRLADDLRFCGVVSDAWSSAADSE